MYRKNDGKMGFSLGRLVTNMFPTIPYDSKDDVEVSPAHQDALFRWQLLQENPKLLSGLSSFMGGVVGALQPFSPNPSVKAPAPSTTPTLTPSHPQNLKRTL